MLVQIRDDDLLSSLTIRSLTTYLVSRGWEHEGQWGVRPAVIYSKEHGGRTWEITVPTTDAIVDYASSMSEGISVLSSVEDRSQLDVLHDVMGEGADIVGVRSVTERDSTILSLRQSADLLRDSYELITSAARSVENSRANHLGPVSREVRDFLDSVHPLPGYYSGHSLTLHAPVPADFGQQEDLGDEYAPPFTRRATRALAKALDHSHTAMRSVMVDDSLDAFDQVVKHGVSSNLCESVASLAKRCEGVAIDVAWAGVRPVHTSQSRFVFTPQAADVLVEVAKRFKLRQPTYDERVVGHVVVLDRDVKDFDGRAKIETVRDGRPKRFSVVFPETEFQTVIRAFDKRVPISVDGDVYPSGSGTELRAPRNLVLLANE